MFLAFSEKYMRGEGVTSRLDRDHYLRPFKKILDNTFGIAPLHICLEAAHPSTLGRSSDLIMRIVRNERFGEINNSANDTIHVHFIPDRLSVPILEGHVVAIGGPRSNVIARIAMEYEATLVGNSQFYQRHVNHTFKMEYNHIHRQDYDGRLFVEMDALDKDSRSLIHHYYNTLQEPPFKPNRSRGTPFVNLFSVNRYLRWRNNHRFPSITASIKKGLVVNHNEIAPTSDFTIYDHFIETILPNVFSENWSNRPLIVYHGLRSLGTYTALLTLSDSEFTISSRTVYHISKNVQVETNVFRQHYKRDGKLFALLAVVSVLVRTTNS